MLFSINKDVAKEIVTGFDNIANEKFRFSQMINDELGTACVMYFEPYRLLETRDMMSLSKAINNSNIYRKMKEFYEKINADDPSNVTQAQGKTLLYAQVSSIVYEAFKNNDFRIYFDVAEILYKSCALDETGNIGLFDSKYCRGVLLLADEEQFIWI